MDAESSVFVMFSLFKSLCTFQLANTVKAASLFYGSLPEIYGRKYPLTHIFSSRNTIEVTLGYHLFSTTPADLFPAKNAIVEAAMRAEKIIP